MGHSKLRQYGGTCSLLIAIAGSTPAEAQSVDISTASAEVGRSVDLIARVRLEGGHSTPFPTHCVHVEAVADEQLLSFEEFSIKTLADPASDWTRLRISHPHRLRSDSLEIRLSLRCGPAFERIFRVLARHSSVGPHRATALSRSVVPALWRPNGMTGVAATISAAPLDTSNKIAAASVPAAAPTSSVAEALATTEMKPPTKAARGPDSQALPYSGYAVPEPISSTLLMQRDLTRLQDELQKTLAKSSQLQARLVLTERRPGWLWWAALSGMGVTLMLALSRRSSGTPHPLRLKQGSESISWRTRWKPSAGSGSSDAIPVAAVSSPEVKQRAPIEARPQPAQPNAAPTATTGAMRWPHADFGEASLNGDDIGAVLEEVEQLIEQGFPAAATITLEQTLMKQAAKHPALLLALLDVYRDMGQPWNHERVGAQLEALYNVRVPAMGELADRTIGPSGIESCHASMERITRTWNGNEAESAIASLLAVPAAVEVLELEPFQDAVWLHAMARTLSAERRITPEELALTPLTKS